jgi:antitoxin FitA
MRIACYSQKAMSMIQIRNVPDELHRELKVRAAQNGMTLSDYLLRELSTLAVRPTMKEWLASTEKLTPVETDLSPAEAIAAERARRPI